jgi:hypothetical protein
MKSNQVFPVIVLTEMFHLKPSSTSSMIMFIQEQFLFQLCLPFKQATKDSETYEKTL